MGIEKILLRAQVPKHLLSTKNIKGQIKNGLLDLLYIAPAMVSATAFYSGRWGIACFSSLVLVSELDYIWETKYKDRFAQAIAMGLYYYRHVSAR